MQQYHSERSNMDTGVNVTAVPGRTYQNMHRQNVFRV